MKRNSLNRLKNEVGRSDDLEESTELPRVEKSILSRNQPFDNWQKKIDAVFRNVLRVGAVESEGMEFEEGEEMDYEDAIKGLEELEERFYDREEEFKSVQKVPKRREERNRENPQVRISKVHVNLGDYRKVNPAFMERTRRVNMESRAKVNQLEAELEKDVLVKVLEHTKKVNRVYEQEIQELTNQLNETMSEEKSKRNLQVRIKWLEKQLDEKNIQVKQYEDKVEEMQRKLESSVDKRELETVKEKYSALEVKLKRLKSKHRDFKAKLKEKPEKQLDESILKLNRMMKTLREEEEEEFRKNEERFREKKHFYNTFDQELALLSENDQSLSQSGEEKENTSPSDEN